MAIAIRRATFKDVPSITSCVCEAYVQHIERIGRQPAPMLADYATVVEHADVRVALSGDSVVGVVAFGVEDEAFWIDNLAVRPRFMGQGIGRRLIDLAEAACRAAGLRAMHLYTNELMTENRSWYERLHFQEYRRAVIDGYRRVYYRRTLPA